MQFGPQKQYVKILSGDLSAIPRFVLESVFNDTAAATKEMLNTEIHARGRHFGKLATLAERAKGIPVDLECRDDAEQFQNALEAKFILNYHRLS